MEANILKIYYQMYYNNYLYASKGNKILRKTINGNNWELYMKIDDLNILNYIELYNRALREGIHNFYKINDEIDAVVLKGEILFFRNKKLLNRLIIEKGSKPLRNEIIFKDDKIIYSEYFGNKDREPIYVYEYDFFNNKRNILYAFNNIRHIHFIQQDNENNDIAYIGTGDLDDECGIFRFNTRTKTIEKIGGNSQLWRAVSVLQKDNYLIWGMDSPDIQPYIVRYNLDNKNLEKLKKIAGPAHYSTIDKEGNMYIATAVEKRKEHKAVIYKSNNGTIWKEYKEYKKDIFHLKYFGFGIIEFMNNQDKVKELFINLKGLKSK